jgi:hypothetical protein
MVEDRQIWLLGWIEAGGGQQWPMVSWASGNLRSSGQLGERNAIIVLFFLSKNILENLVEI